MRIAHHEHLMTTRKHHRQSRHSHDDDTRPRRRARAPARAIVEYIRAHTHIHTVYPYTHTTTKTLSRNHRIVARSSRGTHLDDWAKLRKEVTHDAYESRTNTPHIIR
jgi:hypothetical protein